MKAKKFAQLKISVFIIIIFDLLYVFYHNKPLKTRENSTKYFNS